MFIILVIKVKQLVQNIQQIHMERCLTEFQLIPNRIILRNNNYAQRKITINKKFEWLAKYVSISSPKIFNNNLFSAKLNGQGSIERTKSFIKTNQRDKIRTSTEVRYQNEKLNCLSQDNFNVLTKRNMNISTAENRKSLNIYSMQAKHQAKQSHLTSINKYFQRALRVRKGQRRLSSRKTNIDDSQIRPWKTDQGKQDENFSISEFKQNIDY